MSTVEQNQELVLRVKRLYNTGAIDRETAKLMLADFLEENNKKAKEIAKKYNMKPKFLNFTSLMR